MRFENKKILITGSSSGIGKELAIAFAKEGADIVVNYSHRKEEAEAIGEEIRKIGRDALVIKADVSKKAEVEAMVEEAWNYFGKIDVLVSNSGITTECSLLNLSEEKWNEILGVNLNGTFFCDSAVARKMVKFGIKGHIINISSSNAFSVEVNRGAYNTSKGGVNLLTQSFAAELGRFGIHVNAVAYGSISGTNIAGDLFKDSRNFMSTVIDKTPLGYIAVPSESVGPVMFLASEESSFVQGEILKADGGITIWKFNDELRG
ncbi:MAG: SDR family oxidoreductase [Sphaerochaetaceae bacterium]|nr:SDR family NAD(P)-dependent oxidoreductase [Sphaerochaetaceae bacterium]